MNTWRTDKFLDMTNEETKILASSKPKVALPILETKRLKLIPPREKDVLPSYAALMASVREVGPWFSWAHKNLTLEQHRSHIRECMVAALDIHAHDHLSFLVWDLEHDHMLGECWYKVRDWSVPYVTIAYWFNSRYTGQGYATEAIAEMVRFAFNGLKAKHVELDVSEQNTRSLRLAERLGFAFDRWLNNHAKNFVTNEIKSSALFSMTDISQLKELMVESQSF